MTIFADRTRLLTFVLALAAIPMGAQAQSVPPKATGAEAQAAAMRAHQGFGPFLGAGPLQGHGAQQGSNPYRGFGPLTSNSPTASTNPIQGGIR